VSYNGWTNYETWAIKMWIDNEEPSYRHWLERAEAAVEDETEAYEFAQEIKEYHEEALPELEGFAADLLGAAMSEVNWQEIAESLLGDIQAELEAIG
jgi:hypothetical protein